MSGSGADLLAIENFTFGTGTIASLGGGVFSFTTDDNSFTVKIQFSNGIDATTLTAANFTNYA